MIAQAGSNECSARKELFRKILPEWPVMASSLKEAYPISFWGVDVVQDPIIAEKSKMITGRWRQEIKYGRDPAFDHEAEGKVGNHVCRSFAALSARNIPKHSVLRFCFPWHSCHPLKRCIRLEGRICLRLGVNQRFTMSSTDYCDSTSIYVTVLVIHLKYWYLNTCRGSGLCHTVSPKVLIF